MRKYTPSLEDQNAPPSPRLRDVHQFRGARLTPEELARVFGGNPIFLRRIMEICAAKYMEPTPEDKADIADRQKQAE